LYCLLLLPSVASAAAQRPGGLPQGIDPGELQVVRIDGDEPGQTLRLPLQHTEVQISVSGFVARATVTQYYTNPYAAPLEAVYVFPLPDRAAVDGMTMTVGELVIRGTIKRREEARAIYQRALAQGKRTGLLEQERPNVFTQSVGNLMPGDEVRIEISYSDLLTFRDEGAFELVFPMVVGPRYVPGTATGQAGGGWSQDTDQVPDASRITPPVLRPGERSGHDIALQVDLDAKVAVQGIHSVSHAVDIEAVSPGRCRIRLHSSDTLPNKDFVLRYQVAGEAPTMSLIAHRQGDGEGYFTLVGLPPRQATDERTVPRDLIFVLDTSGSMRGLPLQASKQAMYRLIDGMRAGDRFNVVRFAGDTGTLWPEPRAKTPTNMAAAKAYVESLRGAGGTEMRRGIVEALSQASEPERLRLAILLTDGYVGNDAQILASIEQERRGARVFTLGVGSSVNRYLLDRAAALGKGEAFYLRQDEDPAGVIERFRRRVDRPALAHVTIDWGGLPVVDLTPSRIPDLWQGQPLLIHGRYTGAGSGRILVRGRLGAESYRQSIDVSLPAKAEANGVLAGVWARALIAELMLDMARSGEREAETLRERITGLGLAHRIMTQWTSFVAVEERVVNRGGELQTLVQPVELPDGVDYAGVFGEVQMASPVVGGSPSKRLTGLSAPLPTVRAAPHSAPAEMTRDEALAVTVPEPRTGDACRYRALSVSGGIRSADVDRRLRAQWPRLCRAIQAAHRGEALIAVTLRVTADGLTSRFRLDAGGTPEPRLHDLLRRWFASLHLGDTDLAGTATIRLEVVLL
jgi:Ca-activated chloride channel family protein